MAGENDLIRRLPVSVEAEQSVLGSILIKPESFEAIAGMITADDFYMEEHRVIFMAMQNMFMTSRSIDTVTLVNALVAEGKRDESGGIQYITQIAQTVPTAANIKDYAAIVREKALLRRLIDACEDISAIAYSEAGEASHIIDAAEQRIFDLAQNRDSKEFRHIKNILTGVYQDLVNRTLH
jgi:replicative DNA helicase